MTTETSKAVSIIAKILEIESFVVFIAYLVLLILSVAKLDSVAAFIASIANDNHGELVVNGFSILALKDGNIIQSAQVAFFLAGIFSFACYTMIFRNVYLILKTAAGKTSFSKGKTPFQKDITRMVREIGIFCILIPVTSLILNVIFNLIIGSDVISVTNIGEIVMGLIVIVLSQIFSYGEKLENKEGVSK